VEAAKRESIETVLDAAALKLTGPAKKVLVMGCLAERYTEELRAELSEVDAVVPFAEYGRLPGLLGQARSMGGGGGAPPRPPTPALRAGAGRGFATLDGAGRRVRRPVEVKSCPNRDR
jgi:ribosomal protein S12 methylthiotransferase